MIDSDTATFQKIALVKEVESPENPGGLEKRVALTPNDVGKLCAAGVKIFVEYCAGEGVDFSDEAYVENGAIMQSEDQIYKDKDLIIKFKGPSLESILQIKKTAFYFVWRIFIPSPKEQKCLKITI